MKNGIIWRMLVERYILLSLILSINYWTISVKKISWSTTTTKWKWSFDLHLRNKRFWCSFNQWRKNLIETFCFCITCFGIFRHSANQLPITIIRKSIFFLRLVFSMNFNLDPVVFHMIWVVLLMNSNRYWMESM